MKLQYETEYYIVVVSEDGSGYEVVNKETQVSETKTTILPRAIIAADEYDNFFKQLKKETKVLQKGISPSGLTKGVPSENIVSILRKDDA